MSTREFTFFACGVFYATTTAGAQQEFIRGDINGDARIDISDPVAVLLHLFSSRKLECLDAADANDDGDVDISDCITLLGYLFLDSGPPPHPFPECGPDESDDELPCSSFPPCDQPAYISVCTFNVENFNQSKLANAAVLEVLVRVVREFDLVVVQEVRDSAGVVPEGFLDDINALPGPGYDMCDSPRLGGTEQYVIYFKGDRLELLEAYEYPAPDGSFVRGVFVASFRSGNFDFTLLSIHANHVGTASELSELAGIVNAMLGAGVADRDLIILGDLNADCNSFDEDDGSHSLRAAQFRWVITNDMDTNVDTARDCARDRIILLETTFDREYRSGSAGVFRFDVEYGIDAGLALAVSDHYPVYAEFETFRPDDD
jgi:endonuclease/exonuclease/phosphatase family metal-dependent hydrolase